MGRKIERECESVFKQLYNYFHEKAKTDKAYERAAERFENDDFDDLLDEEKSYIRLGEKKGFDTNYKCRIRPRWYYVPQSWRADAFMICGAHLYPRMILNKRQMLVTNNLHKIRFLEGIDGLLVIRN